MRIEQVAAQYYTIGQYWTSQQEIVKSLRKLKNIGYQAVQIRGDEMPIDEWVKVFDGEGIICCGTHEDGKIIFDNPGVVAERLDKLGCKCSAFPYPGGFDISTVDAVKKFAEHLNESGKIICDAGKTLCYHNHHYEFRKLDGKRIIDILLEETDPRYLQMELDTYWAQYGGGNVENWCRKLNERLPLLHMKDYKVVPSETPSDPTNLVMHNPIYTEIGNGNLDWKPIISAAEKSGCEWFIVEEDECPGDPFDSLKMSFDYIQANLVEK